MMLLIDIGNTRLKWAIHDAHALGTMQAASHAGWNSAAIQAQVLSALPRPQRVLVSNVGGEAIGRALIEALAARWSLTPEFAVTTAAVAGVRCGYAIPSQLGIDRWLGVIAAYHMQKDAACVVNIGTAMTVDGVDASGQHLGGCIVPGPDLAMHSLLSSTSDIAKLALQHTPDGSASTLFADNTLAGVCQGVAYMLAFLTERAVSDMHARWGRAPVLIVSGGASERIVPLLRVAHRVVPDLVLRGLAVLARATG